MDVVGVGILKSKIAEVKTLVQNVGVLATSLVNSTAEQYLTLKSKIETVDTNVDSVVTDLETANAGINAIYNNTLLRNGLIKSIQSGQLVMSDTSEEISINTVDASKCIVLVNAYVHDPTKSGCCYSLTTDTLTVTSTKSGIVSWQVIEFY